MRLNALLSVSSLVLNKKAVNQQSSKVLDNAQKPVSFDEPVFGRRKALQTILSVGTAAAVAPSSSMALDMDAFMGAELDKDTKNCDPKRDPKCIPKLSADEALCKYGQSGNARGEACKRVKKSGGKLPGAQKVKSLGGAYAM